MLHFLFLQHQYDAYNSICESTKGRGAFYVNGVIEIGAGEFAKIHGSRMAKSQLEHIRGPYTFVLQ
jgi:hypothetical protein